MSDAVFWTLAVLVVGVVGVVICLACSRVEHGRWGVDWDGRQRVASGWRCRCGLMNPLDSYCGDEVTSE